MASTGSVVYIRHQAPNVTTVARVTGSVVHVPFRAVSGLFTTSGVAASVNDRGRRPQMPTRDVPFLDADGLVAETWWQWMNYQYRTKQGGVTAPTVPDVAESITTAQVAAIASEQIAAALSRAMTQNAQVTLAIREVVQGAALAGAEQIPRPTLSPEGGGEGGSE